MPFTSTRKASAAQPANGRNRESVGLDFLFETLFFFVIVFLVPALFALVYHVAPFLVICVTLFTMLCGLSLLCAPYGSVLAGGFLAIITMGVAGGLNIYYAHGLPLRSYHEDRVYTNVYSGQSADVFQDAVTIHFAGNARPDTSRALGMTSLDAGIHTYCVAPIVDDQFAGRVQFWAIGVDCCGKLADFECSDAASTGGYALSSRAEHDLLYDTVGKFFAPPDQRRDLFLQATKHAEAVHGLVSSSQPILLHWSSKSREKLIAEGRTVLAEDLGVVMAISVIAAVLLASLSSKQKVWRQDHTFEDVSVSRSHGLQENTAAEVLYFVEGSEAYWRMTRSSEDGGVTRRKYDVFVLGFVVPLVIFQLSIILWSWLPCGKSGGGSLAVLVAVEAVIIGALLVTPGRRFYGCLLMAATVLASYMGYWNYIHNTFNYCSVVNRRSYTDVPAGASSAEYRDAGKMHFEPQAQVSKAQSIGYLYQGTVFCAAPVVGPSTQTSGMSATGLVTVPHLDFWAVGVDCCDARGGFRCPGADSSNPHGLVYRTAGEQDFEYKLWMRAVHAAADLYELPKSSEPIIMQWGEDLETYREEWAGRAVSVILLWFAGALFFFAALAALLVLRADRREKAEGDRIRRWNMDEEADRRGKDKNDYKPLRDPSAKVWFYIDPAGRTQGPFSSIDMRQWYEKGYFKPDQQLRYGQDGEFYTLRRYFPSLQTAFRVAPALPQSGAAD